MEEIKMTNYIFLSTPSGWRATVSFADRLGKIDISIHALRVEGDKLRKVSRHDPRDFYPRPPGGGRRYYYFYHPGCYFSISIHALRVEGDIALIETLYEETDFYPRPPGGGRQHYLRYYSNSNRFLSTPSGWRATSGVDVDG